ncbi:M48 family metallopeptidase [Sphingopyxis sp.]|uniref:M48 family metallopeptidase n=1 Tax=Sphingopyxis sp. TaxID=1908224 RepID=UPI00260E7EDA|nr:M48 family metallopeptidase [Sphingopyxis sp.]MCW0196729.1 M48 family metallopeptidase [Sphingopyxis sp.]
MRSLLVLAPILLGVLLPPTAIASAAGPSPYAELAALEGRVAAIGFRLTTANAAWCPAVQPQFGWIWGDPRLYGEAPRAEARAAYHAADVDAPYIAAVAPGSPADRAGLRVGTPVLAIDGHAVPASESADPFARIAAVETLLAALPPRGMVEISGAAGAKTAVTPVPGCASDFRVDARDRPEGASDGRLVVISGGLVRFAASDDELAAAVAHELAHNILRHRARLDAAGVDRGLGKQFGRSARLFKQTEVEADRLSAWLLAGAGYDPHAAIRFWTRFGQRAGRPLFQAGTHPRWRDRVAAIETEVRAIDAARAAGRPLEPPLIAAPPPLE